jgi:WXG100 family type VII secretion target
MGQIKVSKQDALDSADDFDDVAADVTSIQKIVDDEIQNGLYGEWEGQAADAFKETIASIDDCLSDLSDEVLTHAGLIKDAVGEYIDHDEYLARQMAEGSSGNSYTVDSTGTGVEAHEVKNNSTH